MAAATDPMVVAVLNGRQLVTPPCFLFLPSSLSSPRLPLPSPPPPPPSPPPPATSVNPLQHCFTTTQLLYRVYRR
jgi:hypothetical protein